jgi:hypothetical protein
VAYENNLSSTSHVTDSRLAVVKALQMKHVQKAGVLLLMFSAAALLLLELNHFHRYGHLVGLGLHADAVVSKGDAGYEGITKLYQARLTNYGLLPATVTACDFTTDASVHGTIVAYAVEKWDSRQKKWTTVEFGESTFCRPHPLGIISEAHLFSTLLWPGQSISTTKEATSARHVFQIGDYARFSVFSGTVGDWRNTLPTAAFRIDEPGKIGDWRNALPIAAFRVDGLRTYAHIRHVLD